MGPLRREEHTLFAGKYYSSKEANPTYGTENPTLLTRNVVNIFRQSGSDTTEGTSAFPLNIKPHQLIDDGCKTTYASDDDDPPREGHSSTRKSMPSLRRLSVLWKKSSSERRASLDKVLSSCNNSTNFQYSPSLGSGRSKRFMRLVKDDVSRSQAEDMGKHPFHLFARRFIFQDSSKMQEMESMYQNKEMVSFFEDDFIAFACGKKNNLLQNKFTTGILASLSNKL